MWMVEEGEVYSTWEWRRGLVVFPLMAPAALTFNHFMVVSQMMGWMETAVSEVDVSIVIKLVTADK